MRMPEDSSDKTQAQAEARQKKKKKKKLMTLRLATDGIVLSTANSFRYNAVALNSLAGHYSFMPNRPVLEKLKQRRAGVQAGGGGCERCPNKGSGVRRSGVGKSRPTRKKHEPHRPDPS